jgi:dienelactone hydrolase
MKTFLNKLVNDVAFPLKTFENTSPYILQFGDSGIQYIMHESLASPKVILYSHGNNNKLDNLVKFIESLSSATSCSVYAYEYPDNPTPKKVNNRIWEVWSYLTTECFYRHEDIILMGRSIGSSPTLFLGEKVQPKISAVVLISPLTSVHGFIRTFSLCGFESFLASFVDETMDNMERVKKIKCPLLLIHGEADEILEPHMSQELLYASLESFSYSRLHLVENADHNTINNSKMIGETLTAFLDEAPKLK